MLPLFTSLATRCKVPELPLHWHLRHLEQNKVIVLLIHNRAEFTANVVVAGTSFGRFLLSRQEVEVSGKRLEGLERRLGVGLEGL